MPYRISNARIKRMSEKYPTRQATKTLGTNLKLSDSLYKK